MYGCARSTRTLPLLNRSTAESIQHVSESEFDKFTDMWEHFHSCQFCNDYYRTLYGSMLEFQKKFEEAIKNSAVIRPLIEFEAEEINAAAIGYDPYGKDSRPN